MCVVRLLFVPSRMYSVSVSAEKKVCHIPAGVASCRVHRSCAAVWTCSAAGQQTWSRRLDFGQNRQHCSGSAARQETTRTFLRHQLRTVRLWIDTYLVNSCSFLLSHAQTKTEVGYTVWNCEMSGWTRRVTAALFIYSFICFFMFNLQLYVVTTRWL